MCVYVYIRGRESTSNSDEFAVGGNIQCVGEN